MSRMRKMDLSSFSAANRNTRDGPRQIINIFATQPIDIPLRQWFIASNYTERNSNDTSTPPGFSCHWNFFIPLAVRILHVWLLPSFLLSFFFHYSRRRHEFFKEMHFTWSILYLLIPLKPFLSSILSNRSGIGSSRHPEWKHLEFIFRSGNANGKCYAMRLVIMRLNMRPYWNLYSYRGSDAWQVHTTYSYKSLNYTELEESSTIQ